jgi:hypothetical protein
MKSTLLTGAAALGLMAGAALAQEVDPTAGAGQAAQDAAVQSAQAAGFADAQPLEGAFVLQGTSPTGSPILMVVGPGGELLALANMMAMPGATAPAAAEAGAEPEAGEAADEGFMATQTAPAEPGMWATEAIAGELERLGGSATGATTEGGEAAASP